MSVLEEETVFKELPYYKSILKCFLRKQIGALLEEMAVETGEESIIVIANSSTGTTSCLGSSNAKCFIEEHTDIQNQFLSYCVSGFPNAVGGETRTPKSAKRKQKDVSKRAKIPKKAKHNELSSISVNASDSTISESVLVGDDEAAPVMSVDRESESIPSQPPSLILGVYPENAEDENLNKSDLDSNVNSDVNEPVTNVKEEPLSDTSSSIKTEPELHSCAQTSQSQGSEFSDTSFTPSDYSFDSSFSQTQSPGTAQTFGPIRYVPIQRKAKWQKRNFITMETRVQLLKDYEKGNITHLELAKKYDIGRSTVSDIIKKRHFFMEQMKSDFYNVRKKYRSLRLVDDGSNTFVMNEMVWKWYQKNTKEGVPMNGPIIQKKAKEVAKQLNIENFKASNGWLNRWRNRFNIHGFKRWPVTCTSQSTTTETVQNTILAETENATAMKFEQTVVFHYLEQDDSVRKFPPKERTTLSLPEKIHIIHEFESGETTSQRKLADKYNISKSAVADMIKNRQLLKEHYEFNANTKRKRFNTNSKFAEVNEIVWQWFKTSRENGVQMSGPMIQEKALQIAQHLQAKDFKGSNGWLHSWRNRYNVTSYRDDSAGTLKQNYINDYSKVEGFNPTGQTSEATNAIMNFGSLGNLVNTSLPNTSTSTSGDQTSSGFMNYPEFSNFPNRDGACENDKKAQSEALTGHDNVKHEDVAESGACEETGSMSDNSKRTLNIQQESDNYADRSGLETFLQTKAYEKIVESALSEYEQQN